MSYSYYSDGAAGSMTASSYNDGVSGSGSGSGSASGSLDLSLDGYSGTSSVGVVWVRSSSLRSTQSASLKGGDTYSFTGADENAKYSAGVYCVVVALGILGLAWGIPAAVLNAGLGGEPDCVSSLRAITLAATIVCLCLALRTCLWVPCACAGVVRPYRSSVCRTAFLVLLYLVLIGGLSVGVWALVGALGREGCGGGDGSGSSGESGLPAAGNTTTTGSIANVTAASMGSGSSGRGGFVDGEAAAENYVLAFGIVFVGPLVLGLCFLACLCYCYFDLIVLIVFLPVEPPR